MLLDPRQFSKILANTSGGRKNVKYDGNGVILNLEDVRTFGGIIRFYTDADGKTASSGSQSQPVRVRNPIRLPEMSSFKLKLHLQIKSRLPVGVVAYITPTPELAEAGLVFCHKWIKDDGPLEVSAMAMRKMELETGYPVAMLVFTMEQDASVPGIEDEVEEEETVTIVTDEDTEEDFDDSFLEDDDDFDTSDLLDEDDDADTKPDKSK